MTDALGLAARVRDGEVSARELAEESIARIEATNPQLNFLVTDCFEQALAGEPRDGPFSGVPILIKDLNETAGVRTTFSSRMFAEYVPMHDSAVVRRIKDAGFVVLGKSNTPEFGSTAITESELNGACRNPWNPAHTPGGSSGGAAAAVAAGTMPLAHGSDGGGSIRIPASCCGLFGIKPSRGRVSPAPYVSGSLELRRSGPLSVSVRDAAAFLDAIAGYESGDAHWATPPARPFLEEVGADPGRLRIAFTAEPPIPHEIDPRVVAVARSAADALSALGHEVSKAAPNGRTKHCSAASRSSGRSARRCFLSPICRSWSRSTARSPRRLTRPRASSSHRPLPVSRSRRAASSRSGTTSTSCSLPASGSSRCRSAGSSSPTIRGSSSRRGGEFTPFTPIVNVTGQPAAMVPFDVVDGLPVGVQLIGKPEGEAMLFRLAAQLEEAHPWASRISSTPW